MSQSITNTNQTQNTPAFDLDELAETVSAAKSFLVSRTEFAALSGMMFIGADKIVAGHPEIQTAATDGQNTYWAAEFLSQLTPKQVCSVMLHERLHCMLRHPGVGGMWAPLILQASKDKQEENAKLLNCAMDFVVNQLIKDTDPQESVCCYSDIPKPAVWLQDDKYRGWDVGAVFDDLQQNGHPQLKGSGPGDAGSGGLDQHGLMDAFNALPEHEQQKIMQQIDTAVRMGKERAKMAGAAKGDLDRAMDDLTESKIDWRTVLADFVSMHAKGALYTTYAKPSRRWLAHDIYLPSMRGEALDEPCIMIDTSGSIGEAELAEALGIVKGVLSAFQVQRMHIIYWDADVASHEIYDLADDTILKETRPKGGGGTCFAPVLAYLKSKRIEPTFGLCITDGYIGDWGANPKFPMLFAVTTDVTPPYGQHIKLD